MEEYIVSARKYRPASFDTVVGQKALTETLKRMHTSFVDLVEWERPLVPVFLQRQSTALHQLLKAKRVTIAKVVQPLMNNVRLIFSS